MRTLIRATKVLPLLLVAVMMWMIWPQSLGGDVAYARVNGHSMDGTYRNGDLIVVRAESHYSVGDIIDYRIPKDEFGAGAQVIHRIIGGNGTDGFITKGDNRTRPDDWHPRTADVVGHARLRLAGMGIWLTNLSAPLPLGLLCAGLTVVTMLLPKRDRRKDKAARLPTS